MIGLSLEDMLGKFTLKELVHGLNDIVSYLIVIQILLIGVILLQSFYIYKMRQEFQQVLGALKQLVSILMGAKNVK